MTFIQPRAGPDMDFRLAMDRVRQELGDNPARDAKFVCALTLAWPDGHDETFLGTVSGALKFPPSGEHGSGYDPIFVPTGRVTCLRVGFSDIHPTLYLVSPATCRGLLC